MQNMQSKTITSILQASIISAKIVKTKTSFIEI